MEFKIDEIPVVKTLPLITAKPIVYACNVGSDAFSSENGMKLANKFIEYVNQKYPGIPTIVLSSILEQEIIQIMEEDGLEAV